MEEEQLKTINEAIKIKDEETVNVLNKIKDSIPLTQYEANKIILPLKSYSSKSLNWIENEIEKEYGYGARNGISSHQNAYRDLKKVLVIREKDYNNIIKSIEKLIK